MFYLSKVIITQFKNYKATVFDFTERIVGICGLNGVGKTNLLDAINYLCFTKSYFSKSDALNVQMGADGFRLEGELSSYPSSEIQKVVCIYRNNGKKELYLNDVAYEKFSSHIGKFPCVLIAPDDVEMITGGNEERRKFIDTVLSQMNAGYLQQLIVYNKILRQRNSLLASFAEMGNRNLPLLDVLNEQLIKPGNFIFSKRKEFLTRFISDVIKLYNEISKRKEDISIHYETDLINTSFLSKLNRRHCRIMLRD